MIALPELIALNNRAAAGRLIRRDNFNRDSSFCQSARGFVIHSGIHRSTAFIDKHEHADCWFAFTYWKEQGQEAVNGFIESIIGDTSLEDAEQCAFHRSRPGWTVRQDRGAGKLKGGELLTAKSGSGRLSQSVGAFTWRHLHARTK